MPGAVLAARRDDNALRQRVIQPVDRLPGARTVAAGLRGQ